MPALKKGLVIVGAGGHAKVVLSVAQSNEIKVAGFLDNNSNLFHKTISEHPVLGDVSLIIEYYIGVIGIGNNFVRKTISECYLSQKWQTLIHPTAYVHPSVKLGKGTVVFAGAIIQPDAVIGDHCIINTGATIDHDCILGNYVHVAPGVHLAGGVKLDEGAFLGIGSVAIPGIHIGAWTQVGAGAAVVKNISPQKKVIGIPAKERI